MSTGQNFDAQLYLLVLDLAVDNPINPTVCANLFEVIQDRSFSQGHKCLHWVYRGRLMSGCCIDGLLSSQGHETGSFVPDERWSTIYKGVCGS